MVQIPAKTITLEEFLELPETKPAREYIDGQIIPILEKIDEINWWNKKKVLLGVGVLINHNGSDIAKNRCDYF